MPDSKHAKSVEQITLKTERGQSGQVRCLLQSDTRKYDVSGHGR